MKNLAKLSQMPKYPSCSSKSLAEMNTRQKRASTTINGSWRKIQNMNGLFYPSDLDRYTLNKCLNCLTTGELVGSEKRKTCSKLKAANAAYISTYRVGTIWARQTQWPEISSRRLYRLGTKIYQKYLAAILRRIKANRRRCSKCKRLRLATIRMNKVRWS